MRTLTEIYEKQDPLKYTVHVDDNFHSMDSSESYIYGEYDTAEEALKVCKDIVERSVNPSDDPEKEYNSYVGFGEDPWISGPTKLDFSAWIYAKERIYELSILKNGWNLQNPSFDLDYAIKIAKKYHEGQKDKGGKPYINHPLAVIKMLRDEKSKIVGVLHDTLEDTPLTPNDLLTMGCPADIVCAVEAVTKNDILEDTDDNYLFFIEKINMNQTNQIATDVKWADITHNQDISRILNPTKKDYARLNRYKSAKEILKPYVSTYLLELERKEQ